MPKWRLVISGRVQTAGYRAMVKNIALGMQVKGIARNLDDGTVEVYCEASPENFKQFREAIEVKADARDMFMPNVANIEVHEESATGYGKAPPELKGFKIDYSGVDPQLENLERSEMGIIVLGAVKNEVRIVGQRVDSMHGDMNTRFDTLDTKYGEISKKMNDLTTELQKSTNALVAMTEKVGALIDRKLAE